MKAFKVIVLLFIGLMLMGCGANKVINTTSSSTGITNIGPKLYADCGGFQKPSTGTQGVVSTFVSGGNYVPDLIKMKLTQINSNIATSTNNYIQIFRWSESNGTRQVNPTPAYIVAVLKSNNTYLNNGAAAWDRISKSNIENVITAYDLGKQGIDAANFIANVYFVISGMDTQYQGMSLAFFDTNAGSASTDYIDVLLPAYDANPNTYAASKPAGSSLPALHPNWSLRSTGMTNQQFKDATTVYCQQF